MKKVLLIWAVSTLEIPLLLGQAIDVPRHKKSLLMKMTATWCAPCGDYHKITEDIYKSNGNTIVFINAHVATSKVGDAYSGEFHNVLNGGGGIPAYNINGHRHANWPPSQKVMLDSCKAFDKRPLIANIAFKYQVSGNQVTVQAGIKFFSNDDGDEYYANVFIVENKIPTVQRTGSGDIQLIQERVSRGPMISGNAGIWGQKFASGPVSAGAFFNIKFTSVLNASWKTANLQYVAVVWKKKTGTYSVLSAEDVPSISTGTEEETEPVQNEISVYPNPVTEQMNIYISKPAIVSVSNMLGQEMLSHEFNEPGNKVITMNTSGLVPGIYLVKISCDGKTMTKRIIVQSSN